MLTMLDPFPHWVIDDAFPSPLVEAAIVEWPAADWPHWHLYDGATARKRATKDIDRLTPACRMLFDSICSLDVPLLTGVSGVFPDFTAHGAGMHWIPSGGHLGVHRDSARHPTTGWWRCLSACLYLNTVEGGDLRLYESDGKTLAASVPARRNRLVLFSCGEDSFHGVPSPVDDPAGRKSIAAFFWSLERPGDVDGDRTAADFI